jgi:glycosyltransferase involved in cell wall biosynthesis
MIFDKNLKVAIIILGKNEERTIGALLDKLLLNFTTEEIILIDGRSVDRTVEIAKDKYIKIIIDNGKGKGAAIKIAINAIQSDILVFMDADGSHKPEDIPKLIQPIIDNTADLVIASRMKGGSGEFSGSLQNIIHYIGNVLSSFIVNLIFGHGNIVVTDCNNGFRAIKSSVARQLNLREDSFTIEPEMTIKCLKRGFKIREISSFEFKRKYGSSHISSIRMLTRYIWCFVRGIF